MMEPFIPVEGQFFKSHQEWVNNAARWLTAHPEYLNTEHEGPTKGWRGNHFTALCFDQKGRRCRNGGDMKRANEEGAFPVWWVWPDQIAGLLMPATETCTDCGEPANDSGYCDDCEADLHGQFGVGA